MSEPDKSAEVLARKIHMRHDGCAVCAPSWTNEKHEGKVNLVAAIIREHDLWKDAQIEAACKTAEGVLITLVHLSEARPRAHPREGRDEMREGYEPKSDSARLGYLVEECGEVLAAVGKLLRWGSESEDPTRAPGDEHYLETNAQWVAREVKDLEGAIRLLRDHGQIR